MEASLFRTDKVPDYILEISYKGPTFDGQMEISALGKELGGLNTSLGLIIQTLSSHKRIDFAVGDVEIFVEAFEKGSFRKRIRLCVNAMEKHPATTQAVATIFAGLIAAVPLYKGSQIKEMSPDVVAAIGDQVQIQLLRNPQFLQAMYDVVLPLRDGQDKLVVNAVGSKEVTITEPEKKEFLILSADSAEEILGNEREEILTGKVTRVDLDATKNHIGFKIDNKGTTIPCTLVEKIPQDDMRHLLGQWVTITGTTTYIKSERQHIDITHFKIIEPPRQTALVFEE